MDQHTRTDAPAEGDRKAPAPRFPLPLAILLAALVLILVGGAWWLSRPPEPGPAAPSDLQAALALAPDGQPDGVALAWTDNSENERGFEVWREETNGAMVLAGAVPENATEYRDRAVSRGTTYTYWVRATGSGAPSGWSKPQTITVTLPEIGTRLPAPGQPDATLLKAGDRPIAVRLTWTGATNGVAGYEIARGKDGAIPILFATVAPGITFFEDRNIAPGQVYTYQVRAARDEDRSDWSPAATIRIPAGPKSAAKSAPKPKAAATAKTPEKPKPQPKPQPKLAAKVPAPKAPPKPVKAKVKRPAPPNPLRPPEGLSAEPITAGAHTTGIILHWRDNSRGERRFRVERSAGGPFLPIAVPAANATSYTDRTITDGKTYRYRVRAEGGGKTSKWSNVARTAAPALPPPAP